MKLITYWTNDDVNLGLATFWARDCGASLLPATGRARPPGERCAAAIYDPDHLHPYHRDLLMQQLLARPTASPAALHSYNLADGLADALNANGVAVSGHLEPGLVRRLCAAAGPPDGHVTTSDSIPTDPASLCAAVRLLGSDAHRVLNGPDDAITREVDRLVGEMAQLRRQIDEVDTARLDGLRTWLDRLWDLVESHRYDG